MIMGLQHIVKHMKRQFPKKKKKTKNGIKCFHCNDSFVYKSITVNSVIMRPPNVLILDR